MLLNRGETCQFSLLLQMMSKGTESVQDARDDLIMLDHQLLCSVSKRPPLLVLFNLVLC